MSSFKGVALVTLPGHVPPDEVLSDMLLHNQSCFGMAMTAELEGKKIVSVQRQPISKLGDNQLARMKGVMEKYKNQRVLLFAGSYPEGASPDDMQPHTVLLNDVSGGRPTLVACLVGEFNGKGTDGHSEQWSEINEYLTPKLLPIYEAVGYDIAKFMVKIREAPIRKEIEGYFDRATLTLLSSNDVCMTFGKEDYQGSTNDWGWMSPMYYEAKAEVVVEPPKPAQTDLDNEFGEEPAKVTIPPKVPEGKSQIGAKAPPSKVPQIASTQPITQGPVTDTEMKAPPKEWSNKAKKKWYNQHIGKVPENWSECPLVPVKVKKSYGSLDEASEALKASVGDQPTVKNVEPARVGKEATVERKPATEVIALVPDPKQHKAFLDVFMKDVTVGKIDRNNETINDPALLPSLEQDKPSFAELAKLPNIESSYTWLPERRLKLIKEYPDMAASYMFDLICFDVENARTIQRLNKQITALKAGTAPIEDEVTTVERPRKPASQQKKTGTGGKYG